MYATPFSLAQTAISRSISFQLSLTSTRQNLHFFHPFEVDKWGLSCYQMCVTSLRWRHQVNAYGVKAWYGWLQPLSAACGSFFACAKPGCCTWPACQYMVVLSARDSLLCVCCCWAFWLKPNKGSLLLLFLYPQV